MTGAYDKAAGAVQPGMSSVLSLFFGIGVSSKRLCSHSLDKICFIYLSNLYQCLEGDKSITQKASDATSGSTTDNAENTGKSYLQTAQDTATDAANKVSDTLSGT